MSIEIIVAIVVLIAIVAGVAWWAGQRRRTDRLRERFGPEYERTVQAVDDRRRAESELEARQERVDALDIRPLTGGDRARFGERWRVVQALFVDDPTMAVEQADTLIGEVMRTRGYPVGDFEQRAADISVDHPQVVDHYRTAHKIAERRIVGDVGTEDLRQAFVHYRALFAELLETETAPGAASENARERVVEPPAAATATEPTAADATARQPAATQPAAAQATAPEPAAPEPTAMRRAPTSDESTEPVEPARRP